MKCKTMIISIIMVLLIVSISNSQNSYKNDGQVRLAPRMLNYQGYLTDTLGNPITTSSLLLSFAIFDNSSGGSQKWTETQPTVYVDKGIFNVLLGSVSPIPDSVFLNSTNRWLELSIAGQVLSPRTQIVSTPYSYTATYSDTAVYARNAAADNDWLFRITDGADTTLQTGGLWGLARFGNIMYGNTDSTHVNLGAACTTGTAGLDYKYCTVNGGFGNGAKGPSATVGGGQNNMAADYYTTISGGGNNTAIYFAATVGGGWANMAGGTNSTIGGGYIDTANGYTATVGGGYSNNAGGDYSTISGGNNNIASNINTTVGGGTNNSAGGDYATVGGGSGNTASSACATVAGGGVNVASASCATVGGGQNNIANAMAATVGGGYYNTAGYIAVVSGGYYNTAGYYASTAGGGYYNTASGDFATVSGGYFNTADTTYTTVGGGRLNVAGGVYATVAGGYADTAAASYSFATNYSACAVPGHDNSAAFTTSHTIATNQVRAAAFSTGTVDFAMDHPKDPMNKILNQYGVSSDEVQSQYSGSAMLDANGRAVVILPDYFEDINRNPRIQLTGVGSPDIVFVAEDIKGNSFVIGGKPGLKVYWTVIAERTDIHAEIARIQTPVVQEKKGELRGHSIDDDAMIGMYDGLHQENPELFIFKTAEGRSVHEQSKQPLQLNK